MTESEKKEYLREYKVLGVQLAHDIFEIPETLKYQIIKTIENYVDEKQKELDEI